MFTSRVSSLSLAAAAACLLLSSAASFADVITAKVQSWNPETKILTLESEEEFNFESAKIDIPEGLAEGVEVTIDYSSNDNGVTAIKSLTIVK